MNTSLPILVLAGVLAAPAVTAAPAQDPDDLSPVQIEMDNADIHDVIRIIGDTLELNYVIDPAVQGRVNMSTSETLRRADLLPILETVLKINGASMVRNGNFYEIRATGEAIRGPLEVQAAAPAALDDDQMILQVVRLRFASATEMSTLLTPYLSTGASINIHAGGNVLLVTERRSNLRKLLDVIEIFDDAVFANERVRIIPIRNALAAEVAEDLEAVFNGYALSEDNGGGARFVSIERLNSILVISSVEAAFLEVERWIDRLDQPVSNTGMRNYVYKVQNTRAFDLYNVLIQLYGGGRPVAGAQAVPVVDAGAGFAAAPAANPFATPAAQAPGLGGDAFVPGAGETRIVLDEVTNSLIIHATAQQYEEIRQTIEELDVLPRQVLIDAQIYEVTLDDTLSLGVTATLQSRGTLANPQTTASFAGSPPSLSGQTFAFVGRMRELVLFLNAAENRSRVRAVSAPSVLVSDNMEAQFQVGAEVPVPVSSSITPVQSDGTNLFAQQISFRDTGVLLNVRPQINDSGMVTLEISQEISQAGANNTSGIVAPVIGKSSVTSTIVVQDGQTIALGGFIRETLEYGRNRVPVLGSIPGLGLLFGNTREQTTRSELILLITPRVIRDFDAAAAVTAELQSKLEEVEAFLND